jgi:hypothetical protein
MLEERRMVGEQKHVLKEIPEGRTDIGSTRLRWLDSLDENIKDNRERNWKYVYITMNSESRQAFVQEAKARSFATVPMMMTTRLPIVLRNAVVLLMLLDSSYWIFVLDYPLQPVSSQGKYCVSDAPTLQVYFNYII